MGEHHDEDVTIAFMQMAERAFAQRDALARALENVRKIISDGAMTGFNCHDGDWAERLFASQADTSAVLKGLRTSVGGAAK